MHNGILAINNSCFKGNSHFTQSGTQSSVVVLSTNSILESNENNFGSGNTLLVNGEMESNFCDILTMSGCYDFISLSCSASLFCYSKWMDLSNSIDIVGEEGRTFVICPGSLFELGSTSDSNFLPPILIKKSGTIFICGEDGSRKNECVITGGTEHFRIVGSPTGVGLIGLTMLASSGMASVYAAGKTKAEAFFTDCEWTVSQRIYSM